MLKILIDLFFFTIYPRKNGPWYLEDRLLKFLKYFFVYPAVMSNISE